MLLSALKPASTIGLKKRPIAILAIMHTANASLMPHGHLMASMSASSGIGAKYHSRTRRR